MPTVRLFDTHAHFFTNDFARFPIDVRGARESEAELEARVRDNPASAAHVIGLWDANGVTGGAAVQYNTVYKTDNSYTVKVSDEHHDRVSAVLILSAAAPGTPATLRTLAARHNVSGLRLFGHPDAEGNYPWLDSPAAVETWATAADLGLSMVLMYAPGRPSSAALGRIVALAKQFPAMTITLDHCGWPAVDKGLAGTIGPEHLALVDVPNIHFKATQINFNRFRETGIDSAAFLRLIVDTYGAERVMWGSDYGNTLMPYPQMVADAIEATRLLTDEERAAVLHDNGAKLFNDRL